MCYDESMKAKRILVSTVEETATISAAERAELIASLKQGRAKIAAGDYDVVTRESLRAEFDGILKHDLTDEELDAKASVRRSRR
ncbi:MAG TPA: hypothetical protein VKS78_19295 [Roseiarcus sp.]|nr:hypothetical protein [Roseiarcus sp.]